MSLRTRFTSVAALAVALALAPTGAAAQDPVTSVNETAGEYTVSATFTVPGPPAVAREVLTDYANIPRFMPDVRSSVVVERQARRARVEQEAEPHFMWFSRKIFLVLDVDEGLDVIRFVDGGKKSFDRYEGSWTISAENGQTRLAYALVARPSFEVPAFVLKKLLKRNAVAMIGRLQAEIHARTLSD